MVESRNKEINIKILKIKRELINYKKFAVYTLTNKDINNYGAVFDKGFSACDLMLEIIVLANTRFLVANGSVKEYPSDFGRPIFEYCTLPKKYFVPLEARNILYLLKDFKSLLLIQSILDYESVTNFTDIFDQFIKWFCRYINEKGISKADFSMDNINDFLVNKNIVKEIDVDKLEEHFDRTERMENTLNEVNEDVKEISEQLRELTGQITSYQTIITNILEKEENDEIDQIINERVIQTFADTVSERIINNVTLSLGNVNYHVEETKLINSMGESAWNKLSDSSKTFLITSKVMYNDLIQIGENMDFSGVCILITKALEVEMKKRFCDDFLDFQNKKYGNDYKKFHTVFIGYNNFQRKSYVKSTDRFTMGSIAFALCYKPNKDVNKDKNNKKVLVDYVKMKLIPNKTDKEILSLLYGFGQDIENIREKYRNPSAHTNELGKIDALKCFDIVIDVEKLLKNILDSFIC